MLISPCILVTARERYTHSRGKDITHAFNSIPTVLLGYNMIAIYTSLLFVIMPTAQIPSAATGILLGTKPFTHPLQFKHKFKLIALPVSKATIIAYDVIRPFVRSGTLTYVRATINNATDPLTWVERHHISNGCQTFVSRFNK
jgi:hypothetical protein